MNSFVPPPDKSITIRALLLGAVACGSARVENPLFCEDTEAALVCLDALGVRTCRDAGALVIEGRGLKGLRQPAGALDAGESGALARLLTGLLAGQDFAAALTGRGSLLKRPMAPLAATLKKLGARVTASAGRLPLTVKPAALKGGRITGLESAQLKSAALLAGLYAKAPVTLLEKLPSRDHTERLLALMGARLTKNGPRIELRPGPLTARPLTVPGDISAAAPFLAAALLSRRGLKIENCGLNPTRLGFVEALKKMGARIDLAAAIAFPEPCGTLTVAPSRLKAASFSPAEVPGMIDEIPLLAVCAGSAAGVTSIKGIEALRGKESDRIESTLALLRALGIEAAYTRGVLKITGGKFKPLAPVETFNDHRIAMAAAAAAVVCPALPIPDQACVRKSYPDFWKDLHKTFGFRAAAGRG
ncbi:MAG: 3-phosphoshikimate 1-carboxyvinyltransferase [Elusimicrobiales bacterium]|nr:3-phosphoshikimate 1-carboxyvinyltransferase [Elusimicrobiales bacterium]